MGAWLQHRFGRNRDRLEMKRNVLRRFMAFRWQMAEGQVTGEGCLVAFNEIPVVFAGDVEVEKAFPSSGRLNPDRRARWTCWFPLCLPW